MADQHFSAAICALLNEVDTTSIDPASLGELRFRIELKRIELCSCPEAEELLSFVACLDRVLFDIDVRILDLQQPRFASILSRRTPG